MAAPESLDRDGWADDVDNGRAAKASTIILLEYIGIRAAHSEPRCAYGREFAHRKEERSMRAMILRGGCRMCDHVIDT